MEVKILLFARLREAFGQEELTLDIENGSRAEDLIAKLSSLRPELHQLQSKLNVAVNQDMVGLDHILKATDEIAVFPPVGGG
jgi:molybdopterin converting factor subunit 1